MISLLPPCPAALDTASAPRPATNQRRPRTCPPCCSACEQIRCSDRLRRVLAAVLAAGNQLNAGTARGGAGGLGGRLRRGCAWAHACWWHRAPLSASGKARLLRPDSLLTAQLPVCSCPAASIKLDSLLKLNDVKVTATPAALAAAASTAALPRRHSSQDEAAVAQPAAQQQPEHPPWQQANGSAAKEAAPEAQLPPVKTLLEFVAWVVLQQEAGAAGGGTKGAAGSSSSGSSCDPLARAVKAGFLQQQLSELPLAVRRMQTGEWWGPSAACKTYLPGPACEAQSALKRGTCTHALSTACPPADVADSLRGLEAGMRNLQQELDFELEQQRLKASSSGGGGGDDASPTRLAAAGAAGRQAAFASEMEAAASPRAGSGGAANGAAEPAPPQDGQAAQQLPPFAAVLQGFLEAAQQRQAELEAAGQETGALVRATLAWLGEPSPEQEAAVFELLFNFTAGFDHCCKKVHRLLAAPGGAR